MKYLSPASPVPHPRSFLCAVSDTYIHACVNAYIQEYTHTYVYVCSGVLTFPSLRGTGHHSGWSSTSSASWSVSCPVLPACRGVVVCSVAGGLCGAALQTFLLILK